MGTMAVAAAVAPDLLAGELSGERRFKDGESVRLKQSKVRLDSSWDVIVVGGGPGGCTAAIAAAREGAKVLLIEATGQLGGMGTAGMVPAWCPFSDGEKIIYRGLAERIFNESKKGVPHEPKGKLDWVNINPEYLMRVYDRMVTESGASVLFFSRVAAVEKSADDTVDAIIVANQLGLTAFRAKIFVDATGNGDLSVWAGATYMKSDVLQDSTLCFALANVNGDKYYGGLHSDNKQSPIHKVVGPDGKYPLTGHHFCMNLIGPNVVQFNAGHIHADTTDPRSVTEAMMTGRQLSSISKPARKPVRRFSATRLSSRQRLFSECAMAAALLGTMSSPRRTGTHAAHSRTKSAATATTSMCTRAVSSRFITKRATLTESPTVV